MPCRESLKSKCSVYQKQGRVEEAGEGPGLWSQHCHLVNCDLGQATWHPRASLSDLFIKKRTSGMAEVSYGVPALFHSISFPKSRSEWILRLSSRSVGKECYLQPVVSSNTSQERKDGGGRLAEDPAP